MPAKSLAATLIAFLAFSALTSTSIVPTAQAALPPTDQDRVTQQAQAVTPSATIKGHKTIYDIPKKKRQILTALESVEDHALKGKTLDWRKAKKYDKGYHTDLKKFAAWFKWSGGHLDNISKKDLKAVKKYQPSESHKSVAYNNPPRPKDSAVAAPNYTNNPNAACTGYKGVDRVKIAVAPYVYMNKYNIWLDSCTANYIRYALNSTAAAAGVVAVFTPAGPAAAIVGACLVIESERIALYQGNSRYSAVQISITPPAYVVHYYSQ